jgi:general secretion pathway protein J
MMTKRVPTAEAGFTLMEALLAMLLMTVILAALATVTAQWLPNWSRGVARVQRAERLAMGLERVIADLSVAQMIPLNADAKTPLFDGTESSVMFVRSAVGPNAQPGLDIVRLMEQTVDQGLAMVRERATFVPMAVDAPIRFAEPVVLIHAPLRVVFSYAGPDQAWQESWQHLPQLPSTVRIAVKETATGRVLAVSSASIVHINLSVECARGKGSDCPNGTGSADQLKKPGDPL